MKKRALTLLKIFFIISFSTPVFGQKFTIARIHYSGGGDWYSDPSSLPNLLKFVSENTHISVDDEEVRIRPADQNFFKYPYLYLTGHGNVRFSEEEITKLRETLLRGAFLHADDNYGMDASFREEMKRIFPNKDLVELPYDHPVFHVFYDFPSGLPKIHEHDGNPPQALGLFDENRLMILYTFECDLGDGWEDPEVHNDPEEIRLEALQMGVNIIYYSMTQ
ncbi:MAG TPA: DUF4159 domain-containing protein [Candidatus Marinimicrobia bacterium]|jgi:hypothetical protein|nr:DUF4159 domain-containing protein [Candidatus Neomarinimicrobiota bacterium]|tara:strand:+ start:1368 stop:2030 length:663 start_codon:yes stop_codon:yes gene_type:complete